MNFKIEHDYYENSYLGDGLIITSDKGRITFVPYLGDGETVRPATFFYNSLDKKNSAALSFQPAAQNFTLPQGRFVATQASLMQAKLQTLVFDPVPTCDQEYDNGNPVPFARDEYRETFLWQPDTVLSTVHEELCLFVWSLEASGRMPKGSAFELHKVLNLPVEIEAEVNENGSPDSIVIFQQHQNETGTQFSLLQHSEGTSIIWKASAIWAQSIASVERALNFTGRPFDIPPADRESFAIKTDFTIPDILAKLETAGLVNPGIRNRYTTHLKLMADGASRPFFTPPLDRPSP